MLDNLTGEKINNLGRNKSSCSFLKNNIGPLPGGRQRKKTEK